jgi:hypothetical protein
MYKPKGKTMVPFWANVFKKKINVTENELEHTFLPME